MKEYLMTAVLAAAMCVSADGVRVGAKYGDVKLHGPVGDRLAKMIKNHVVAKDTEYLTECFKERAEKSWWDTEFWGKYMHGAVPLFELTQCPLLKTRIETSTAAVMAAQDAEGYIGNYSADKRFGKWTWDVWGCKYVMMGLLHYYDLTGDKKSLDSCLKLCDYVAKKVGPGAKVPIGSTGNYAGMPSCSILEPVMWLYNRTNEKRVLEFADFIVKEMTERKDGPRLIDLALAGVPVSERTQMPAGTKHIWDFVGSNRGKAYEMMSCYQGLIEYYQVTGKKDCLNAAIASAASIIRDEINLAGGSASYEHWYKGSLHQHEAFPHTQETCVTITWMRLCQKLLEVTGDVIYADEFEKAFYNAYLASLNPACDVFAAYTPLSGTRSEGHIHCFMHTNCCNENGPRGFVAMLGSFLQAKDNEVFLNWYNSAMASIKVPSLKKVAKFEVYTQYPREGHVDIFFRQAEPMKFKFSVRIPSWAKNTKMKVNDYNVEARYLGGGKYVSHDIVWKPGDHIQLDFELPVEMHKLENSVAFTRGPILLARDNRFQDGDLTETLREGVLDGKCCNTFALERSPDPAMWITVGGRLPLGGHGENPNLQKLASVRFCDYASAANEWKASNACRTWLNVEQDPATVIAPPAKAAAGRIDRSKMLIGTYTTDFRNPTDAQVKDMADAGLDYVFGNFSREALDRFQKHGVKVFLDGAVDWWWGGADGVNGKMAELRPLHKYFASMRAFKDHPAVAAIAIGDEPSAMDFDHMGKAVAIVNEKSPCNFTYLNLFPSYAAAASLTREQAKSQLGTSSYEEHIEQYCQKVPLDYICFDSYIWGWGNKPWVLYENLRVVGDACTATGKSLWIVLQENTYQEGGKSNGTGPMTMGRLRFQSNVAMAFGAEMISWACWKGWWDDCVIGKDGKNTFMYDRIKKVNGEIHTLGNQLMKFRRQHTDFVDFKDTVDELKNVKTRSMASSSGTAFTEVKANDKSPTLVGHFLARDGSNRHAMFVVACDDPHDKGAKEHVVTFRADNRKVEAMGIDGKVPLAANADGSYSFKLTSNAGVIVIATRK